MKLKKLYSFLTLLTASLLAGTGTMWGADPLLTEDFEGGSMPSGWTKEGSGTWSVATGDYNSSTGAGHGTYNAKITHGTTGVKTKLITPEINMSSLTSNAELSYMHVQRSWAGDFDYLRVYYRTSTSGSWTLITGQEYTSAVASWTTRESIALPNSAGCSTYQIAFEMEDNYGYGVGVDYVRITPPPTCPKTGIPAASSITTDAATISWTPVGTEDTWNLHYKKSNAASWTEVNGLTSTTYDLTSLSNGTTYKYEVQADCGGGDESDWNAGTDFTTECGTATLPFEPAITAGSKPNCWTIADASWGDAYSGRWYTYVYSSKNCLRYQGAKGSAEAFVQTPSIVLSGKAVLKFKYANYNSGRRCPAKVYVSDGITTKTVTLTNTDNATLTDAQIDLSNVSGTNFTGKTITIKFSGSGHSSSSGTGYVWIADIQVEAVQDCSAPQNVVLSGSSVSTADFAWDANAGVDSYKYCIVAQGEDPDFSADSTATTNAAHVAELTPGNYTFYVKCACGVATTSLDFEIVSCPSVTGVSLSNQLYNAVTLNWTTSATTNCDVQYKIGEGVWTEYESNISASSESFSGLVPGTEYSFRVKPNCSADGWVSPVSTYEPACPALGALTLSNKLYNGVTVSWPAATGISTWTLKYRKGSDDWTTVNNIDEETYTISSGLVTNEEYTIELYSECGNYVSTTYMPVYEIPAVLTVSPVKDVTATLNWSTVDGATGYQYSCVPTGDADAWSATQVANSASLSGLTAGIEYTAKVRAVFGGSNYSDPKEKVFSTSYQAPTSLVKGATTSSSLAFSWSKSAEGNADNRYQYVCKTGSAAPTADQWANDAVLLDEGVRSVTVEDLSIHTTYYFFVRSYYGVGKYSSAINTFNTTDCGIESLEYSETFGTSSATKPGCWTIANWGTSANSWTTASDYAHSGVALKYNAKTSSSTSAISPSIEIAEKCTLCFYVRNAVGTGEDYVQCQVYINDGSADTEITNLTTNVSGTTSGVNTRHASATAKYYDLSSFVGKTITIRFKGVGYSSGTTSALWIDDVSINYKSISAPTNLAAAPTADGAEVIWDAAEGPYDLRYRENGSSDAWTSVNSIADKNYTIESLTADVEYEVQVRAHASANRISSWTASQTFTPVNCPVPTSLEATEITHNSVTISWSGDAKAIRYKKGSDDWSNETISPADESFDLSGLVAESTYTVQVKADCEDGDNWSAELEFTTKCAPITITKVAPYEADFAGLTNEMPACWNKSETTYPYVTSEELKFYANESNQTAILPTFSNDIATLVLKFSYKNYSDISGYGKLQVGYIDNAGDFQTVGSTLTNKASYFETEVNFDGVSGAKNIAIRFLDNANTDPEQYAYSYIKDVVVELAPTCVVPASIANPTSVTASGATFTWAASTKNTETYYQYICVPAGETPNWNDATKVAKAVAPAANTAVLSGLNAHTSYDFYVRSWCSEEEQSEVISKNFETECGIETLPYAENFNTSSLNKCWTVTGTSSESYNWKTYTGEASYEGAGRARFTATTSNAADKTGSLESPSITLSAEAALHFVYMNPKAASLKVYIKEGEEERVELADLSAAQTEWTDTIILLKDYKNKTVKIFFDAVSNCTSASYVDIDNFGVLYSIPDNADNSATLAGLVGQTVDFVVNRTFKRDFGGEPYFNTICLPFSLSAEELAASPLKGAELWTFKYASVVNDELQVRIQQESSLKAGRPYLILFEDDDDLVNPLFKNVKITATSGEPMSFENIAFIGTLAPVAFTADDQYRLFLAANNQLAWANATGNVRSFRAYFQITPPTVPSPIRRGMKARIVMKEEVTTGVEEVQGNNVQSTKFLENNQVIIIRNGVKYNLQGQAIK